jgi:outer membrane biosynthesis protein TonB
MRNRDFAGVAAVVLATGVVLAVVVATAGAAISHREFSPDETTLLSTVLGAAIGAVATYLGTHGRHPEAPPYPTQEDPAMTTETPPTPPEPEPTPEPTLEPEPAPPDEESDQQQQVEPTPPESEEEELEAMTGGKDPADL